MEEACIKLYNYCNNTTMNLMRLDTIVIDDPYDPCYVLLVNTL